MDNKLYIGNYTVSVTNNGDPSNEFKIDIDNRLFVYMSKKTYSILKLYDYELILDIIHDKYTGVLETGIFSEMLLGRFRVKDIHYTSVGLIGTLVYECNDRLCTAYMVTRYPHGCTREQLKSTAHTVFKYKTKTAVKTPSCCHISLDQVIDWDYCFDSSNPDNLYRLFRDMQANFQWSDIENLVYTHSIFGQSYYNAVRRISTYRFNDDGEKLCSAYGNPNRDAIPAAYIVYEEFFKILRKYYYAGANFSDQIYICYVKDHLNDNHTV